VKPNKKPQPRLTPVNLQHRQTSQQHIHINTRGSVDRERSKKGHDAIERTQPTKRTN